ncbi:hypothetical protein DID88_009585 [Monilinia fructigena]|uniref:D-xylose 1-dehydrogenase (NADP(+), D-xylono-1,5-lactone-forming) n=1 Tax=Monilinia fructigena TaxID=38457 RepID=A0A395IN72_9HELO|nr:hypothetical protein DID88_009585 [Monilinia fructigena]
MASKQYEVRWGILATGGIATTFCKDILCNPSTRNVHDIQHTIVAAASSSSASRAETFLKEIKAPPGIKAYGSYHELVNDPNIDVIYIATPHSHHFQNAMLALRANKHVLCEKALTVNVSQARKLFETAKERNLFFMEAPGPSTEREVPSVLAAVQKYEKTGVDEQTSIILQFPKHKSVGIATTGMRVATQPDANGAASKDEAPSVRIQADPERENWGHGMAWEADEVGRCLRDGKKESGGLDWRESEVIMEVMDEVRRQGGLKYSEEIESDIFDEKSGLNGRA